MTKFDAKTLNKATDSLVKSGKDWRREVHKHMVNILDYVSESRDVTPAYRLFSKLSEMDKESKSRSHIRSNLVRIWFERFAFCRVDTKATKPGFKLAATTLNGMVAGENDSHETMRDKAEAFRAHRNEAKATPFWTLESKSDNEPTFDLDKLLESLIKRVDEALSAVSAGTRTAEKVKVNADRLAALKAIVA